eukprot:jgi/Bigna1/37025/e_gw1.17.15.1
MPKVPIIVADVLEDHTFKNSGRTSHIKKYAKGRMLGKGGFAHCYKITSHDSGRIYACKVVAKASITKQSAQTKLWNEISLHKKLNHPHIVRFERFFEDDLNVYILLELCHNQSMMEMVRRRKRLTQPEVKTLMWQLILCLHYLHKLNIIHRDLKLSNLFLDRDMNIKLGDFGLTTRLQNEQERKRTICGTPNYIAPEILDAKKGHSFEVDIWAVGVIMYTTLVGKPPFETSSIRTTYKRIRKNIYTYPDDVEVSDSAKDLIGRILHLNPAKRLSLSQIADHRFFTEESIPKVLPTSGVRIPPAPPSSSSSSSSKPPQSHLSSRIPASAAMRTHQLKKKSSGADEQLQQQPHNQKIIKGSGGVLDDRGELAGLKVSENSKHGNTQSSSSNILAAEGSRDCKMAAGAACKAGKMLATSIDHGGWNHVWVTRWCDYTSKYGMGYALSDGSFGVCFNDQTKIAMHPNDHRTFDYMPRRSSSREEPLTATHSMDSYPVELRKKVLLLSHFKTYLARCCNRCADGLVVVKRWLSTAHAMVFRLSNRTVQFVFNDHTELLLSSGLKVVCYSNKIRKRKLFKIGPDQTFDAGLEKRIRYAKDVLSHMLGGENGRLLKSRQS